MNDQYILLAIAFVFSFALSYTLTPFVRKLAIKHGYVDDPKRNHPAILHTKPIPRAGGIAIYIAFVTVALIMGIKDVLLIGLIIGGGINVFIGTLDDKHDLSPKLRLGIQALSAIIVILSGVQIYMSNPFGDNLLYFDQIELNVPILDLQITLIADLLLIFWIVMLMNTTNWTKGASQLPGVAVIAFVTLAAVALKYQAGNPYQLQTALLSIIMAGSVLAFLPFNFPPERMFPGFGASTFIGFMLAVLSVLSGGKFATIAIVFAIPIIDALLVGLRRIRSGKSPLQNDREHFYHLLLNKGYRKQSVIIIYWFSSFIFAFSAYHTYGIVKLFVLAILTITFSLTLYYLYKYKKP